MEERDVCRCVHLRANVKLETLKEMSLLKVLCKVCLKLPGSEKNCDFVQVRSRT